MNHNFKFVLLASFLVLIFSLSTVSAATVEVIDQKQEAHNIWEQILAAYPLGQEFTPTMSPLIAVEVYIKSINPTAGPDTLTVNIRQTTITGTILGTASQYLSDVGYDAWLRFDFPGGIALTPGSIYVIEVSCTKTTFGWGNSGVDVYPGGRTIQQGSPNPGSDQAFRTYSIREVPRAPVGGILTSANKLTILAPHLTLIGLVAALTTATVVVKRRRKA